MIRSTACIAAFLVARIGGCDAPRPEVQPKTADNGAPVRIERWYEPGPALLPTPGETNGSESAPRGEPGAAGTTGGDKQAGVPAVLPPPAPLGLLGRTEGAAALELPPGGVAGEEGVIVTPEPSTLLLAAAGLAVGALWRRRKRGGP